MEVSFFGAYTKRMNATRSIRKVLIVGGGIGGPVLGMWLRRIGLDVVVAEARSGAALAEGAFLGVAPNGMNAVSQLDLADAISKRGHPCEAFRFSNRKGAAIGSIDRSADRERFGFPLTMIRRSDLHVLLADAAIRRGVDVQFDRRLVDLDLETSDTVVARFADGGEREADIVIGCDGARSTVRKIVMPDAPEPRPLGLLDCGGFARASDVLLPSGVNEMVFGRRAFFGVFRTAGDEIWWFHNGPPADRPLDERALRARLLELHHDDPPWIGRVIESTPKLLGPWPLHEIVEMPRWWNGRVCLLGDAAHAMSPSAGQGASMAFEDALVLARCLREHHDPAVAFAAFEHARRRRVDAITRFARRSGSGKAIESRFAEWLRDRLLPLFIRLGGPMQTKAYGYRLCWEPEAQRG
jgi:FAD-dependent urate hydroxylase